MRGSPHDIYHSAAELVLTVLRKQGELSRDKGDNQNVMHQGKVDRTEAIRGEVRSAKKTYS
jgi:hypothetical protein